MLAAIIIASALTCGASQPPINAYYIEADPSNPGDSFAAQYLSTWVASAAGVNPLPIVPPGNSPAGAPILGVGFAAASLLDPTPPAGGWSTLGAEGHLLQTGLGSKSSDTAVTGAPGAPRGTLYAAYALVEKLGVRFWAPNVTSLPGTNVTTLPDLNLTYVPPLEYRSTDNWQVEAPGTGLWSASQRENDASDGAQQKPGGGVSYASPPGFGNNAATWVDPNQWSSVHPEWFGGSQQLCYSSPTLLQYLTVRAREFLAGSPNASIITLAQNDNQDYCKTPPEMEIIEAEGGAPSGPLLRAINFIAANLSVDFPNVAVDTLAYQYTRKAPNTTRPSPNVIVRLCDIEANFGVPLSDMNDSTNAAFASDLRAWAEISERLYIWDYVVDFSNTVMPWPNYFVMGPNIRFLLQNHVRGIFEEGDYWSAGGELQELKSWLLLQLLYNPAADDRALITEFINGFYGPSGAAAVGEYMDMFAESFATAGGILQENVGFMMAYLTPQVVLEAATILNAAVASSSEPYVTRLRTLLLAPQYVALLRWDELRAWAAEHAVTWPLAATPQAAMDAFSAAYDAAGMGAGGLSEGGHGLAWLQAQLPPNMTATLAWP